MNRIGLWEVNVSKKIGIEIGSYKTKIVLMKVSKLKTEVVDYRVIDTVKGTIDLNGDINVLKMEAAIHDTLKEMKISGGQLHFAINHESIIIRTRKLPYSDDVALENLVRFEAESFLPYDISEFNIDYKVLSISENKEMSSEDELVENKEASTSVKYLQNVMIVAAPKSVVDQYIELAKKLKLKLKVLTVYTEAMDRYLSSHVLKDDKNILIVDLGASFVNMLMYSKLEYFANIRSHYGIEYLVDEVKRVSDKTTEETLDILFSDSNKVESEPIQNVIQTGYGTIIDEISKMVDFFKSREFGTFVDEIHLLGGGCKMKDFKNQLEERLEINVKYLDIKVPSKSTNYKFYHGMIPAVGVCMEKNKVK